MHFMNSFNRITGKHMPLVVILCLTAGITFSKPLGHLIFLVPYVFAFMTFAGALNSNFRQLLNIARHPLPLIVSLVIIHAVIPLIALAAGKLFFHGYPYFVEGIILEYVVPSAVVSVMWCTMSGGDIALTLSLLLIDTLTAPLIVPFSLSILIGVHTHIDALGIMKDLTWMVTIPAFITMLLNQFSHDRIGKKLSPIIAPYGKIALIFIVTVNSTRVAPFVLHMTAVQFEVLAVILILCVSGYVIGWLSSLLLHQKRSVTASMTFGCGMRNINAGAVIASAYFPPEVMFPVMVGTLFQQALASIFSHLLTRSRKSSASLVKS